MNYYRILADNTRHSERWFLDEPLAANGSAIDAWEFCYGRPYHGVAPTVVPIYRAGQPVAVNLAAFDMPVVSKKIAAIIDGFGPGLIQRFPVTIGTAITGYEILNVVCQERCLDESRARFQKWRSEDERPDRVGQYRQITRLVIDPLCTHERHIFRLWGFDVVLVVSDVVKRAVESIPDLGVVFQPVTGENAGN